VLRRFPAPAKLNLGLVVGPRRAGGKHEVTTVLQRIDVSDRLTLEPGPRLRVAGFAADTLVSGALTALAEAAGVAPAWSVRIWKRIPVASGLGGGSSDAATALRLANATLERPLAPHRLRELAAGIGADVPFFLAPGPQLGEGDGTVLTPLELPQDFWIVLVLPGGPGKRSTAAVYDELDRRGGAEAYEERRSALLAALAGVRRPRDLASLPPNDLASSPLAGRLRATGAFRADVSGAGPAVYGLFHRLAPARDARRELSRFGRTWLTVPAWYG
jgi:4-diphosphocytidyl-2-C-methyl-D-erythritol kinase